MMRPRRPPLVLGHRGYRARYPENTLLSFRKALECGADGIECDVQKTADGRYVIIHDPIVDRISRAKGNVHSMRLDRLRRIDVGCGERIPTLEELLEALPPGAYIDVELKKETLQAGDCGPIADILDARVPRCRLMVSSFEPSLLLPMKARGFTVGLLLGDDALHRGPAWLPATLLSLRPQYLNLPIQMFRTLGRYRAAILLRLFRVLGFRILFWTVNEIQDAEAVAGMASIVVSDEVERIVRLLKTATPARPRAARPAARRVAPQARPPRTGAPPTSR